MKAEGKKTFWGAELGDDISKKTKKLLGVNLELHTHREATREQRKRGKQHLN